MLTAEVTVNDRCSLTPTVTPLKGTDSEYEGGNLRFSFNTRNLLRQRVTSAGKLS